MGELLVIVPSRGRPERFAQFVKAWEYTSEGAADLLVCLDDDDPTWRDYQLPGWAGLSIGPRNGFAPRLNAEALDATVERPTFAIASFGDDHLPRTQGWDTMLVDAAHELGQGSSTRTICGNAKRSRPPRSSPPMWCPRSAGTPHPGWATTTSTISGGRSASVCNASGIYRM